MATLDTKTEKASMTLQDLKRAVYGKQKAEAVQDVTFLKYLDENPNVREEILSDKGLLDKHDGRTRMLRKNVQVLLGEAREEIHIAAAKERYKKGVEKKSWGSWALGKVGGFVKKHPLATVMLLLASATGAAATAAYMAGGVEALFAQVGISHLYGSTGAAEASEIIGKVMEGGKKLFPDVYDAPTASEMH